MHDIICQRSITLIRYGSRESPVYSYQLNDITDLCDGTVNVKLYADDIKIYFEIVNNADVDCLQKGINDLCIWAEKWQLRLSIDGCFHLHVGLIKSVPKATYTLYGTRLNRV